VLTAVRDAGVTIKDLATENPDLEDVFMALTYGSPRPSTPRPRLRHLRRPAFRLGIASPRRPRDRPSKRP